MLWSKDLSLFSPQAIGERHNRSLLIQFLLFEIIEASKAIDMGRWEALITPHPRFFPYDWCSITGYLNKMQEHSMLLGHCFPDHPQAVADFEKTFSMQMDLSSKKTGPLHQQFKKALQKIYTSLEPLIVHCSGNENLLFFLLKNRPYIDALTQKGHLHDFILKIYPCGLETLGEKMCDQYHQRGFFSQIQEFKHLLTELSHG